jgi:hypothetical protein
VRKALHPGTGLLSDPNASVMTAAQMKPGFVDDRRRQDLQRELMQLVQDKYRAAVSPKVRFRIALVDLTEAKRHTPIFAGFWAFNANNPGGGATLEGRSFTKILALYAVYQLRFDLNTFAKRKASPKVARCRLPSRRNGRRQDSSRSLILPGCSSSWKRLVVRWRPS